MRFSTHRTWHIARNLLLNVAAPRRLALAGVLACVPALSGCLVHTHTVQQPIMPSIIRDAAADQLVQQINDQDQKIHSLKASVGFQFSVGGARKGKVTDYTTLSGYILLSDPERLRVLGLLPVVHTPAFDLASDGKQFTLVVPHTSKAYVGSTTVVPHSTNPLENLRPSIFFDTMLIRAIDPNALVERTIEMKTRVDAATGKLLGVPEYALTVEHRKPNSQELIRERVIHFDRTTLKPSGVDIYDSDGNLQTRAVYGEYATFGDQQFPATITITRPVDEYKIVLSFQKVTVNQPLNDNQFEMKIPEGYTVKRMD